MTTAGIVVLGLFVALSGYLAWWSLAGTLAGLLEWRDRLWLFCLCGLSCVGGLGLWLWAWGLARQVGRRGRVRG